MKTTKQERLAFIGIAICVLIAGWLDGQDHKLAQKYAQSEQGQQLACIHCGGKP